MKVVLLTVVIGGVMTGGVPAMSSVQHPYGEIAERNMFGLKPKVDDPHQEPPKPPINLKMTGFVRRGSEGTRVLLAMVPKDPKEQMRYFNLGVGEKEDGVEVLKIHPGQDAVDVVIDGVPEELTVKSNSFLTGLYEKTIAPPPSSGVRRNR